MPVGRNRDVAFQLLADGNEMLDEVIDELALTVWPVARVDLLEEIVLLYLRSVSEKRFDAEAHGDSPFCLLVGLRSLRKVSGWRMNQQPDYRVTHTPS